ncbi:MAG: hypothetical protein AAFO94_14820, partial [Bacteroidota bacterium]
MNKYHVATGALLRTIVCFSLIFLVSTSLSAQCTGDGEVYISRDCANPVMSFPCAIDGACYSLSNDGSGAAGGPPFTSCDGTANFGLDNPVYIGFTAIGTTVELDIIPSNCVNESPSLNYGIQSAIFSTCSDTAPVSNCESPE